MKTHASLPGREQCIALRRALCRWFQRERRDLPWRRTREPYAVWISEAMLQQTRVETVIPYYRRFLARFPDVQALATAEEDQVLAHWSGLGYYSRARALRRAARELVERHGGVFPRTREAWLTLPGVGPYTAGAVLSIAFGLPEPLVDGNVARVFARLFLLEGAPGSKALRAATWALARALVPAGDGEHDPGDWNQGLMELGARLCTRRAPRCEACPLHGLCAARRIGRQEELPRARARPASVDVRLEMLLARRGDDVLLVRRPPGTRMADLFELPTRELRPRRAGHTLLWPADFPEQPVLEALEPLGELAHAITHHRIRARLRRARVRGRLPRGPGRWVGPEELGRLGLTGLTKKALALARELGS